jgi:hypothetical protein
MALGGMMMGRPILAVVVEALQSGERACGTEWDMRWQDDVMAASLLLRLITLPISVMLMTVEMDLMMWAICCCCCCSPPQQDGSDDPRHADQKQYLLSRQLEGVLESIQPAARELKRPSAKAVPCNAVILSKNQESIRVSYVRQTAIIQESSGSGE